MSVILPATIAIGVFALITSSKNQRGASSLFFLGAMGFCGFGFLASFEPGVHFGWKIGYTVAGVLFLVGVVRNMMQAGRT